MPTLAELLRDNPRGWGTAPPKPSSELRSALSPEADYYGQEYGPYAGVLAQKLFDASSVGRDVARSLSGIPGEVGAALAGARTSRPFGYGAKTESMSSILREGGMREAASARTALDDYRAIGVAGDDKIQTLRAGSAVPAPGSQPLLPSSQSPKKPGLSPDNTWNAKTGRWHGPDGKFRPGEGPAND